MTATFLTVMPKGQVSIDTPHEARDLTTELLTEVCHDVEGVTIN